MRIAIVTRGEPGEEVDRMERFEDLIAALSAAGHDVEPALYDERFAAQMVADIKAVDLALVWVNPIDAGRTRTGLDQLLRDAAAAGVMVSAHPDVVLALGTKEVLYDSRNIGWGTDTQLYRTMGELEAGLSANLVAGPRVLKQHRGSSGNGVWSVELVDPAGSVESSSKVRVRHAKRGSADEVVPFAAFCERCLPYFDGGLIIDQQFQPRLGEGMVRCYLVRDRVEGFGHQATNALIPVAQGAEPPTPTTRHYFPPTKLEHQRLKDQLERDWIPALLELFGLQPELPLLWDCDFLLGPADHDGHDTYVLCEINVSSVAPYPSSVVPGMVDAIGSLV